MTIDRTGEYTNMSLSSSSRLKSSYQNLHDAQTLFPKIDQTLVLDILRLEGMYKDWEGSVSRSRDQKGIYIQEISTCSFNRRRQNASIQSNTRVY